MDEIEQLLREWNGEMVIMRYDQPSGAWIIIAIHSTHPGSAGGGTRMKPYASLAAAVEDAMRLAEGMTYKLAVPEMPLGGAKAVIATPPNLDSGERLALLRRYGAMVRKLGGLFVTAPDVGTSALDLDIVSETGAPFVWGRSPATGGLGETGPITAMGVFAGIQTVCEYLFGDASVRDRRVLVQGTGQVGAKVIEQLRAGGAEVLFNDVSDAAIYHFRDELGLQFVPAETLYETECDIYSPCALGGTLNEDTIPLLRCRAVAGGANNQLAVPADAERLAARGILYAPDYVMNAGAAMALVGTEKLGWSYAQAEQEIVQGVPRALRRIFEVATAEDISTEAAARRLVDMRLHQATG